MKQKKQSYDTFELINEFDDISSFKNYISNLNYKTYKLKGITYINLACEIDIESSSFIDEDGNKVGLMYCFTFGINGHSYFGRTKEDLLSIISFVCDVFKLGVYLEYDKKGNPIEIQRRMIFFIHNLGYEFQYFMKWFKWNSVFALKNRTPVKASMENGIELRCSYLLSGYSLEMVGKHLQTYKVQKMVGDLDYKKIRTPITEIYPKEKGYVLHDGLVVMAYIQEQIESHSGKITALPLTKTGEVRKYCRNMCLYGGSGGHKKQNGGLFLKYHYFISNLTIQSINEYKQLKRAFAGGFTHANPLVVGNVHHDIASLDETSAYPYVMLAEKYPMTNGRLITIKDKDDFYKYINLYCCVFDVTFINIESKIWFEHYISQSHCYVCKNPSVDNGRLIRADEISTTITEQDFKIIEQVYKWDKMKVKNMRIYKRDYLPKEFILAILKLYGDKTTLKDVEGYEKEYLNGKEKLNSCYGMAVTDICREVISFCTDKNIWNDEKPEIDYAHDIEHYNKSKTRFLAYQWGVWVTAHARYRLWGGILGISNIKQNTSDYLYSDTDSLKVANYEKHKSYFERENQIAIIKLKRMCEHYDIPFDLVAPKTIKGETKIIGLWEFEYTCDFKTLGAKRYMIRKDGKYKITIAGLNKNTTLDYILRMGYEPFEFFKDGMYIPATYEYQGKTYAGTGKNTHTYIDEQRDGLVKDYQGNYYEYHIESGIHMEESDYTLSLASEFVDLLLHIERIEYN